MEVDVRLIPNNSESSGVSPYATTQAISQFLPEILVVREIYWVICKLLEGSEEIATDIADDIPPAVPVDATPDAPLSFETLLVELML